MDVNESISEYFLNILAFTNQMKTNGDKIEDLSIIEKVLRTLPSKFDYIVVVIEESKDLISMTIDELQRIPRAHINK